MRELSRPCHVKKKKEGEEEEEEEKKEEEKIIVRGNGALDMFFNFSDEHFPMHTHIKKSQHKF